MNLVIVFGRIVSNIEFKFIYDRYKKINNNNRNKYKNELVIEDKYKHTSIASCKIKLLNNSVIEIHGYDAMADYMYKNLKNKEKILIEGKLSSDMHIEVKTVYISTLNSNLLF